MNSCGSRSKANKNGHYSCVERHIDNVYLNVVFQNMTLDNTEILAEYNVAKTIPVLDKPSNYYAAVVRFDVPLNAVPLLVIPIVPNQGNANLTPFTFTINASSTNVIYAPDNDYTAPVQNQMTQVITPYYYVYSFQNVLDAFNVALATSYTAAGSPGGAGAPFFVFNPVTQLVGLVVSVAFISAAATISINAALTNYLEGFRLVYLSATNTLQFVLENNGINGFAIPGQTTAVASPPTFLLISQEYTSMEYWLSLRKIVLVSTTIPISYEYTPAYSPTGGQTGVSVSVPIITDFVPNIESAQDSRSIAVYNPSAQYRLVDLLGDSPLYNIDLRIQWQDKLGNYYPMYIEPYQQASVKIGFFRRDLYEHPTV